MRPLFSQIKKLVEPETSTKVSSARKLPIDWAPEDNWSLADHMCQAEKIFKDWSNSVKQTPESQTLVEEKYCNILFR